MSKVPLSEGFWHKQWVNRTPYKALSMTWTVYYTYHENFHWNSSLNEMHITKSKSRIVEPKINLIAMEKLKKIKKWTENAVLQKLNLSKLQKTDLSDVGSAYYCSPSFFQTWSRKLAINTLRSLASIFSNSLGSFLETKNFFNNETSLCVLLNVFLFFWCCTNSSKE